MYLLAGNSGDRALGRVYQKKGSRNMSDIIYEVAKESMNVIAWALCMAFIVTAVRTCWLIGTEIKRGLR